MPTQNLAVVFLFSFVASFGAVVSPGPVSAAIVSEGPRSGWKVGPLIATGHSLLEAVIVVFIAYGLSSGLASPGLQQASALLGSLILFWIGGSYLYNTWRGQIKLPSPGAHEPARSSLSLIGLGLMTTLSNPFWYAWWVTVAAGYLAQAQSLGLWGPVTFYVGHISADYLWDTFLSGAVSWGGRWLTERRYQILIGITGLFMLYLGATFLSVGLGFS